MSAAGGFEQACNVPPGVDIESHLVVIADVVDRCNDKRKVLATLRGLGGLLAVLGKPVGLVVDTGYFSRAKVAHREVAGLTPYIAAGRKAHDLLLVERCASPPPCTEHADSVMRMAHRLRTPECEALHARRDIGQAVRIEKPADHGHWMGHSPRSPFGRFQIPKPIGS